MGERLERLPAVDHGQRLAEVLADRGWKIEPRPLAELAGVEHLAVEADAVDGPVDPVEGAGGQHLRGLLGEPVRLTELDPGQDAQSRELRAAAIDRVEVAGDVDRMLALVHERPVGVLGEGDGGQTDLERPLAAAFHVPFGGVPGPFGVHVEIGRQRHPTRLPGVARRDGVARMAGLWSCTY